MHSDQPFSKNYQNRSVIMHIRQKNESAFAYSKWFLLKRSWPSWNVDTRLLNSDPFTYQYINSVDNYVSWIPGQHGLKYMQRWLVCVNVSRYKFRITCFLWVKFTTVTNVVLRIAVTVELTVEVLY